jgi:hypothetical protein
MTANRYAVLQEQAEGLGERGLSRKRVGDAEGFRESAAARSSQFFTLDEWQQAKRAGIDPRELRGARMLLPPSRQCEKLCGMRSKSAASFSRAVIRRGFVAVTTDGDVYSLSRVIDATRKLTSPRGSAIHQSSCPSRKHANALHPSKSRRASRRYIAEAKRIAHRNMEPLIAKREALKVQHQAERQAIDIFRYQTRNPLERRATHSLITSAQGHCRCMGLSDGEIFQNPQAE